MADMLYVPYSGNMSLGSLYNAYSDEVCPGLVFGEIKKPMIVHWNTIDTSSKRIYSKKEACDFLGVSSRLALGARASGSSAGLGISADYLSGDYDRSSYLEILETVQYLTETDSVNLSAKPILEWKNFLNGKKSPTHYVRSIYYGGVLLTSIQFKLNERSDRSEGFFDANLGGSFLIAGGNIGTTLEHEVAKYDYISDLDVRFWTTVQSGGSSNDIKGLQTVLDNFCKAVKETNGGKGIPMKVELAPLTYLYPDYTMDTKIYGTVEGFIGKLYDLSNEIALVFADANKLLKNIADKPLAYNLHDDLQDFIAETSPLMQNVTNAVDRIDFTATRLDRLFEPKTPETNPFITDGIDTKQCQDIINYTYRVRFMNLKSVITTSLMNPKSMLQVTLEYNTTTSKFLVRVLQAADLPPRGLERHPDPYVVVFLLGQKESSPPQKTEVVSDNQNPVFNASANLAYEATWAELPKLRLRFEVFDKERIGDDVLLVAATIPLVNVRISSNQTRRDGLWVQLNKEEMSLVDQLGF